jgi:PAS domain S-box-containing protein
MFEKLNKFRKKTLLRDYIILAVLSCLFLVGLYFYKYYTIIDNYETSIEKIKKEHSVILENEFDNIKSDIEYLSSSSLLLEVVANKDINLHKETKKTFYNFMKAKNKYDQLRLIDKNGNEIIRIDKRNLLPVIVKDDDLQNKFNRYYFKDAMKLKPKDIYMSELDLNKEHGNIEVPIKPMMRFVKPLYDNRLNFQGAIVLNFKAEKMLEKLRVSAKEFDIDMIMLSKHGNIIEHPNFNYNWSFMYKDAKIKTLQDVNKELWKKVTRKDLFLSKDLQGIFSIQEYFPYKLLLHGSNNISSDIEKKWYIILGKDSIGMNKIIISQILALIPFIIGTIIVLVFLIWRLINFRFALKNEADHKLISIIALDTTSQAVVVSNKKYKIVHVNKAFLKTTGYCEDEIIGQKANSFISNAQENKEKKSIFEVVSFKDTWEGVVWSKRKDERLYPSLVKIDTYRDKNDEALYYITTFNDLSEQIKIQKSIELKNEYVSTLENEAKYNLIQEKTKYQQNDILKPSEIEPLGELIVSIANEIEIPLNAVSESSSDIHRDFDTLLKNIFSLVEVLGEDHKKLFIDIVANDLNFSQIGCFIDENSTKKTLIEKLEKENINNIDEVVKVIMQANLVEKIDKIIPLLKLEESFTIINTISKICSILINTNNIELAVVRATSIVQSLEHFSHHKEAHNFVKGQISQSIESVLVVYEGQIQRDIHIKKDFGNFDSIYCDFEELFKVWNLMLQKAIQQMNYKGEITIKILEDDIYQIVEITEIVAENENAKNNKKIEIDTSVKKIVEKHKGKIEIENEPNKGLTFKVFINKNLKIKN